MSRGFILTTDSVIAVILSVFIAVSVLTISSHFVYPRDDPHALREAGRDLLASLEASGELEEAAISGNNEALLRALNSLPPTYCASIQIFENTAPVMQVNRTGCTCENELVIYQRTFLAISDGSQREMFARFGGCFT